MNSKITPGKEPKSLFLLALLAFFELFFSGIATLLISPDPKNALIFGFSAVRIVMVACIWILAVFIFAAGFLARKHELTLSSVWLINKGKVLRYSIYGISYALIAWGWLAFFCPAYLFHRQMYIFERIQPFSVAMGIICLQSWLFYLFAKGYFDLQVSFKTAVQKYYRPFLLFAIVLASLEIFIISSKFGLLSNIIYANVPGIPLTGVQLFFIIIFGILGIALVSLEEQKGPFVKFVNKYRLIPILIFLTALLTWGLTPMLRNFFSLEPTTPTFQPFPYSDARLYDLGGISILRGYGIFFYQYIDKPFYLVLLALLHAIAGQDYKLLTWLQILILALIPVLLFKFGKKFQSTALGICLALILIIRQRNAIILSTQINSINPKLLMTEEFVLLGVILFAYLVFKWMQERKIWLAVVCGGCIGVVSLFRVNPIFLFPMIFILFAVVFWSAGKRFLLAHLSAYSLAFLIIMISWLISSVSPTGTPYFFTKLQLVIEQRYGNTPVSLQSTSGDSSIAGSEPIILDSGDSIPPSSIPAGPIPTGTGARFLDHLLHNFSTSIMSLPDSLFYDDLNHLSQRVYWLDHGNWVGDLPPIQIGFIFINLSLIALGLGYGWVKHRWLGMIPLAIFLAYTLSLGLAMNSGGRYIVPIDWTIYFYYILGIIGILQFLHKILAKKEPGQSVIPAAPVPGLISDRRKLAFSIAGTLFMASLIPIANFVIPPLTSSSGVQGSIEAAKASISASEEPGVNIFYGDILYPYYTGENLSFDLLTPSGAVSYSIDLTSPLKILLRGGEHVFLSVRSDALGVSNVESIYLWRNARPALIWQAQP